MDLNAEIRAELGRQRLTYADLAEKLDSSRQNMHHKLTSGRPVSSTDLFKIATALGVPASELMRRTEEYDTRQGGDAA